jgi:hypothetical protein
VNRAERTIMEAVKIKFLGNAHKNQVSKINIEEVLAIEDTSEKNQSI